MLKPTSGTVDAASTSTAAGMSACEKSSPNMAIATIKSMKVRARPYAMAKRQMPSRCVSLRTVLPSPLVADVEALSAEVDENVFQRWLGCAAAMKAANLIRGAVRKHTAAIHHQDPIAQRGGLIHVMGAEQHRYLSLLPKHL